MKNEIKHTSESVMGASHRCLAGSGETIQNFFTNNLFENGRKRENKRE